MVWRALQAEPADVVVGYESGLRAVLQAYCISKTMPTASGNDFTTLSAEVAGRDRGERMRIVLQPAALPASTSASESPIIHEFAKSIP